MRLSQYILAPFLALSLTCAAPQQEQQVQVQQQSSPQPQLPTKLPSLEPPFTEEEVKAFCLQLPFEEKVRYVHEHLSQEPYYIESNKSCPEYLGKGKLPTHIEYALSRVSNEESCADQHRGEIAKNKENRRQGNGEPLATSLHVPVLDGLIVGGRGMVPEGLLNVFAVFPSVRKEAAKYERYLLNEQSLEALSCIALEKERWEKPYCENFSVEGALLFHCLNLTLSEAQEP